jgi:hypothetical protein
VRQHVIMGKIRGYAGQGVRAGSVRPCQFAPGSWTIADSAGAALKRNLHAHEVCDELTKSFSIGHLSVNNTTPALVNRLGYP